MLSLLKFFVTIFILCSVGVSNSYTQSLDDILNSLPKAKFAQKEVLINQLGSIDDPVSLSILESMSNGSLYYVKKKKPVVFTE